MYRLFDFRTFFSPVSVDEILLSSAASADLLIP